MPPTTPDTDTISSGRNVGFRLPERLDRQIKAVSEREGNPFSATVRRLLTIGLEHERRSNDGGGDR